MSTELDKVIARMDAIMDNLDLGFVEAAHHEREQSYRIDSPTQTPLTVNNPEGKSNVEFYAPTTVTVLAYPILYCIPCNAEHACAYTNVVDASMGVCLANYHIVKPGQYAPSTRVPTSAERSIGGVVTRT